MSGCLHLEAVADDIQKQIVDVKRSTNPSDTYDRYQTLMAQLGYITSCLILCRLRGRAIRAEDV